MGRNASRADAIGADMSAAPVSACGRKTVSSGSGDDRHRPDSYIQFLAGAAKAIDAVLTDVSEMIDQRALGKGFWHPNGFAIFHVTDVKAFGVIRLHVWPASCRRLLPRHPRIHNHGFRLYSRVLAGEYVESLYTVADARNPEIDLSWPRARMRKYVVAVSDGTQRDIVADSGSDILVGLIESGMRYSTGSCHDLEAGIYHSTQIRPESLCATVAVLSERVADTEDVLVGRPGFVGGTRRRVEVAREEIQVMCAQLSTTVKHDR